MLNLNISRIFFQSLLVYLLEILLMKSLRNLILRSNWFVLKLLMGMQLEFCLQEEIFRKLWRWKNRLLLWQRILSLRNLRMLLVWFKKRFQLKKCKIFRVIMLQSFSSREFMIKLLHISLILLIKSILSLLICFISLIKEFLQFKEKMLKM